MKKLHLSNIWVHNRGSIALERATPMSVGEVAALDIETKQMTVLRIFVFSLQQSYLPLLEHKLKTEVLPMISLIYM